MPDEIPQIELETPLKRAENILFSEIDQDKVMIDIEQIGRASCRERV